MFCKACGEEINDLAYVCIKCGVKTDVNDKSEEAEKKDKQFITAGYIFSFIIPIIGIIYSVINFTKGRTQHGAGTLAVSILSMIFWLAISAK
jgi:uncharacterized membrane protein YvbJ